MLSITSSLSKKSSHSHAMLVSDIGRFYMAIDHKLRLKDCRADNVYRFIEQISHLSRAGDVLMTYELFQSTSCLTKKNERMFCTGRRIKLGSYRTKKEVIELKKELQASRKQVQSTRQALKDFTNESSTLKKQRDNAREKVSRFKESKHC